ncbi:helix-turn-helix transcriptional regulator [Aquirufa sp. HETE-83D]|uniref:Helix-turn-helix transcriptional regulator n=1 Tax=Aquirufa esocilacus TaxID=3096513 RepID=A0ABW6DIU8_9BACT
MFNHFSRYLKLIRAVPLHVMAQDLGIDAGLLSKYENGNRIPDLELVIIFAHYHEVNARNLCVMWMRERIKRSFVGYEHLAEEALADAEKDLLYFLRLHRVKQERKFSFKLILKNPITYDHNLAANLRHFQFRRHGVTNH